MLPTKRQKEYTISILAGLIVNIILNLITIPFYGAFGAAVTTTIAQFVVVLVQVYYIRNQIEVKRAFLSGKKYLIASIVMFVICCGMSFLFPEGITTIIVKAINGDIDQSLQFILQMVTVLEKVIVGAITYFIMLILLKDKFVYEIRDMVIKKLKRK